MRKFAANLLPKNAVITSCDVRSSILVDLAKSLLVLATLIAIPLSIFLIILSTIRDIQAQSHDWWFIPTIFLILCFVATLPWIFQKSKTLQWFYSFFQDGIDLGKIRISGPTIILTIIVVILNVFLYLIFNLTTIGTWPLFTQLLVAIAAFLLSVLIYFWRHASCLWLFSSSLRLSTRQQLGRKQRSSTSRQIKKCMLCTILGTKQKPSSGRSARFMNLISCYLVALFQGGHLFWPIFF